MAKVNPKSVITGASFEVPEDVLKQITDLEFNKLGAEDLLTLESQVDSLASDKLNKVDYIQHYRGLFSSYNALKTALPNAVDGDYAHIDTGADFNRLVAIWDSSDDKWIVKEASVISSTDEIAEGSINLYHKNSRVLNAVLSGLAVGIATDILSTDSIITALQKLQAQVKLNQVVWVGASTVATAGSDFNIDELQFARINGNLWVRGVVGAQSTGIVSTLLTINNINYKIKRKANAPGLKKRDAQVLLYQNNETYTFSLNTINTCIDAATANSCIQTIESTGSISQRNDGYHVPMVCLGELVIK